MLSSSSLLPCNSARLRSIQLLLHCSVDFFSFIGATFSPPPSVAEFLFSFFLSWRTAQVFSTLSAGFVSVFYSFVRSFHSYVLFLVLGCVFHVFVSAASVIGLKFSLF
jgi:hypothetical protein